MSFFSILFILFIFPASSAATFSGIARTGGWIKLFLNSYPYHILVSEKSGLNRLLLILFSKTKNKRPFIYYTRIGYIVLAILQIPIAMIIYYLKLTFFRPYFWILLGVCSIPNIFLFIMIGILEHKEKMYKKKMGFKVENFWDYLKSDKKFNALKEHRKQENAICKAVEPYIRIKNPKKRKATIVTNDIEKVNSILEKDFPQAFTELTTDEKGNTLFCVYFKEREDRLVIKAFVKKH